jgi:hypothetical protein
VPSTKPRVMTGLECWLVGTDAELDVALAALQVVGAIPWPVDEHGRRDPEGWQRQELVGEDTGRRRQYVRVLIAQPQQTQEPAAPVDMGLLTSTINV